MKIKDRVIEDRFLDIEQEQDEDFVLVDEDGNERVGARIIYSQREVDALNENTRQVAPVRESRKPAPVDGEYICD